MHHPTPKPSQPTTVLLCCGWLLGLSCCQAADTTVATAPFDADHLPHTALKLSPSMQMQDSSRPPRWALGFTVSNSPSYAGGTERTWGLRPIVSGEIGRWSVSTSSARRMMSSGTGSGSGSGITGGIATSVFSTDRWDVGLGLRLTQGRNSTDGAHLSGLPDIDPSVALRAAVRYQLDARWQLHAGVQQDLLERQGLKIQMGLGWQQALWQGWALDVSSGVGWANGRAMRTQYGVSASAVTAQRPMWTPDAGMESWFVGAGLSRPLSKHWRVAGSLGYSNLLGQAAQSPLTLKRDAAVASFSIAYVGW